MSENFYIRRKKISGINIVPLIDVMTVLIFFFLMSMRFDDVSSLGITPPSSESATKSKAETRLVVAVSNDGKFFVNSEFVPAEKFSDALKTASEKEKTKQIILVADEEAATKFTVFVVDNAQTHGLSVQLITRENNE